MLTTFVAWFALGSSLANIYFLRKVNRKLNKINSVFTVAD